MANRRASTPVVLIILKTIFTISSLTLIGSGFYLCIESLNTSWTEQTSTSFIIVGVTLASFGIPLLFAPFLPKFVYEKCCHNLTNYESIIYYICSLMPLMIAILIIRLPMTCGKTSISVPSVDNQTRTTKYILNTATSNPITTTESTKLLGTQRTCTDTNNCRSSSDELCDEVRFYIGLIVATNGLAFNLGSTIIEWYA